MDEETCQTCGAPAEDLSTVGGDGSGPTPCECPPPPGPGGCTTVENCTDADGNPVPLEVTLTGFDPDGDGILNVEIDGDLVVAKFATFQGEVCTEDGRVTIVYCIDNGSVDYVGYIGADGALVEGDAPSGIIPCTDAVETALDCAVGTGDPCAEDAEAPECFVATHDACVADKLDTLIEVLGGDCTGGGEPGMCDCVVVYVEYDPDVHQEGTIEGDGSAANPFQVPLPAEGTAACPPADLSAAYTPGVPGAGAGPADCCCAFDGDSIDCAPGLSVLVSDGDSCGPADLGDIVPGHAFSSCASPGETIDAQAVVVPPITGVTSTELDRGQVGALVYNTNPFVWPVIPVGTFPLSIPVPASDPDCILALHVAFGHENTATFSNELSGPSLDASGAADLTNQATAVDTPPGNAMSGQAVYVFDPASGAGGGTVDLDFAIKGAEGDGGSVQWYWDEICAASGPIEVADLDLGNVVSSVIAGQPASDGVGTSDPIDTGGCDAIVFATARHVTSPSNSNALHVDSDWFGISAGSEIYDTASTDCDFTGPGNDDGCCQHGSAHAVVPAGSGPWTWTYTTNAQWQNGISDSAKLSAIPIVCAPDSGGGSVDSTNQCSVEISNPNCAVDGVVRCSMRGSVKVCIPDGETSDITVVPVLDGVELADQALGLQATGAMCTTIPVAFSVTDLANPLAPGDTATKTFGWRVAGGLGTVELSDWVSECEVIHL
jgi:hypothetical protein